MIPVSQVEDAQIEIERMERIGSSSNLQLLNEIAQGKPRRKSLGEISSLPPLGEKDERSSSHRRSKSSREAGREGFAALERPPFLLPKNQDRDRDRENKEPERIRHT